MKARIPVSVQDHIFSCFVRGLTAKQTVATAIDRWKHQAVSRVTVNAHFKRYREAIRAASLLKRPRFTGEVEIDIGFFIGRGAKWESRVVRRMVGLDAASIVANRREIVKQKQKKRPILGILNRGGDLILLSLQSRARKFLEARVRQVVERGSVIYSDMEGGLNRLSLDGYIHRPVNHAKGYVDRNGYHINGIESFWREAKANMSRFRGIPRSTIDLHIYEQEFRYNHRHDLKKALKAII